MIIKIKESGFCAGVRSAVNQAEKQYGHILSGRPVYLYGNLVNNEHVMERFLNKGFFVTDEISSIPSDAVVIIRAHGVPKCVYDELKIKNLVFKDCTCVRVIKIHDIVYKKSQEGYKIIIVGKSNHPEVIGTAGWCVRNLAYVVERESDVDTIDLSGKVCVVAQTTCSKKLWGKISKLIFSKNNFAQICDTTCKVTGIREEKAMSTAKNVDMMVVIGDRNSSNSKQLYNTCSEACQNTFFVSSLSELINNKEIFEMIINSSDIGLVSSASTCDNTMLDVYNYLLFIDFFKSAKKEIEIASYEYLNDFCKEALDNCFVQDSLKSLFSQYQDGKRIRGFMINLGEKIASHGKGKNYLPIAVAYELFQTSVLIHDDIIDKSQMRRNKATINFEFAKNLEKNFRNQLFGTNVDFEHFGNSKGICIGDYGFFISYMLLSKCSVEKSVLLKIYELYSKILTITCEGQIMDVLFPFKKISILCDYEEYMKSVNQIYEYKTAWYTLAGPIMLGAVCAGADDDLICLLKDISILLGIAYQIQDDILGVYSNESVLGKPVLSDIRENKQTILLGYAYKYASENERFLLDKHYGKSDANKYDLEVVQKIFEKTSAKKYAQEKIILLCNQSKKLIDNELIDKQYQSILNGLISYLINRKF